MNTRGAINQQTAGYRARSTIQCNSELESGIQCNSEFGTPLLQSLNVSLLDSKIVCVIRYLDMSYRCWFKLKIARWVTQNDYSVDSDWQLVWPIDHNVIGHLVCKVQTQLIRPPVSTWHCSQSSYCSNPVVSRLRLLGTFGNPRPAGPF